MGIRDRLVSGAVGNFIDRVRFGYVRDFIYFKLINFPVFNVADCYVTVSVALLIILILFVYKEDDFGFLKLSKKGDNNEWFLSLIRISVAISDEAVKKGLIQDILIEVNVAGEENKFGVTCEEAEEFVKKIGVLPGIKIRGFMTSAPFVENPEDNRKYFRELKQLLVDINNKNIDNVYMNVFAMGMTNDYTVAVEEGATHVRVGTAIFGARDYSH